ncbi:Dbl homology domain-containing protein [Choanephora cucurbitarum]|nr:Dbl homology domain-containing protein [Choanephora cucurbitarum]
MPPLTYPITFEEIEAKAWASNTVSDILTDITPVSFEPYVSERVPVEDPTVQTITNDLKRSFSFLESGLFRHYYREKEVRNSRRSQSTIIPPTHPTNTPIHRLFPRPSISGRIRQRMDRFGSVKHQLSNTSDLFHDFYSHHKPSAKEQKGIALWKETYAAYLAKSSLDLTFVQSKRSVQLSKFIMNELLTTEETYLNHLLIVQHYYQNPLLEAASAKKKPLVNLRDVEIIFAYIPQLIDLSTTLVERLRNTIENYLDYDENRNQIAIGKTFCDLEKYFDIYIYYAANFVKSKKHLAKASSSIIYRQLVQDSMQQKKTNRLLLSDYMIAPIQRITRYCLLLKDLRKHLDHSFDDYVYINTALNCLSALAYAMNAIQ